MPAQTATGPRIYNLFPLLAGPLPRWQPHLERAQAMGFDWIFINPIQQSGHSGSLYAIKDYYAIDPRFLEESAGSSEAQFASMVEGAKRLGLKLMADLVINHTAFDSPLVKQHPDWYKRGADGQPVHPGVEVEGKTETWGDLFEIDNLGSPDRENLWAYWRALIGAYLAAGFSGFRCDAAYKVPVALWRYLIGAARDIDRDVSFFAETLGCPSDEALEVAASGFDFVFNSSKWWDFREPWCLDQYRQTARVCRSISFAESHDTERLASELDGDQAALKMRYAFSALLSSGVMMPIGFEHGFRRRLDVTKTRPKDWERPAVNLTGYIARLNNLKSSHAAFNQEGPLEQWDAGDPRILMLVKWTADRREKALILINHDRRDSATINLARIQPFLGGTVCVEDLSPERRLAPDAKLTTATLEPSAVSVLYAWTA
jgi:starch synthase (maltosyl-transferring)